MPCGRQGAVSSVEPRVGRELSRRGRIGGTIVRCHAARRAAARWAVSHLRISKREITDACALRAVIDQCRVVRVGAVDEAGIFVVPMNFGYDWREVEGPGDVLEFDSEELLEERADVDEDRLEEPDPRPELTLYVHSATEGRKASLFSRGAQVAIEMDIDLGLIAGESACAYSRAYRSIMGTGYIEPVEDLAEKHRALALIMAHLAPDARAEFSPAALERTGVFRIAVREFTGKEHLPNR